MAQVLLEGIYRVWVDIDAKNEEEAQEKLYNLNLKDVIKDGIPITEIEDFQVIDFEEEE